MCGSDLHCGINLGDDSYLSHLRLASLLKLLSTVDIDVAQAERAEVCGASLVLLHDRRAGVQAFGAG